MLGNGNRVVIELAEALARVVPVDDPHFLFASDGAAAVEQALKIAFQYWANHGRRAAARTFLAFGGAYHGDTIGALSVGDGGFGTDALRPAALPRAARARLRRPRRASTPRARWSPSTPSELAAVIVEPLVQGAAGMQLADPDGVARARRRVPRARRAADLRRGRHRLRPHRHAVRVGAVRPPARPAVPRQGPHRRLPADVGDGRERAGVRRVPRPRPVASARCTTGTRTAGTRSAAAVALRHLELLDAWRRARQRARPLRRAARRCSTTASRRIPRSSEVRLRGLMGGVELAPPADGLRWGRRVCAAAVERGVLLRPLGDVVVLMPPLTITSEELHRIVARARRRARRGDGVTP